MAGQTSGAEKRTPRVFISYTHESPHHKAWVLKLATDLRLNGVNASLDRWDLHLGQDVYRFMEESIREADRVLVVCTPQYVVKAKEGRGGVGIENLVVTAEMTRDLKTDKFVCVVRRGQQADLVPGLLSTRLYIDFAEDLAYPERLDELLRDLHGVAKKPPLGAYDPSRRPRIPEARLAAGEELPAPPLGRSPYEATADPLYCSPEVLSDVSHKGRFYEHFLGRARNARKIVMIGTGLNLLQGGPAATEIMELVRAGRCEVEVYLADPYCPDVEARLIEEEMGEIKPPVGQSGLIKNLAFLLETWGNLGGSQGFSVRLFTHYPTFALLIADEDYYFYPYGYATLGNYSPVFHFSGANEAHGSTIGFLKRQYDQIRATAYDAKLFFARPTQQSLAGGALTPFALYFIPPLESELYSFGTDVLGYDIHNPTATRGSRWGQYTRASARFGFHMTVCDVLYFWSAAHLARIRAEIAYVASRYAPFELSGLQVKAGFPDRSSIAIAAKDPSGTLEALHHELVQRVYRRAAGSDYSLHLAEADRDNEQQRAQLLVERFRAPYILGRFQPHFTLVTAVPPQAHPQVGAELKAEFGRRVHKRSIMVRELAIMRKTRPEAYERWEIADTVELGK
jgi:hypothetical protein